MVVLQLTRGNGSVENSGTNGMPVAAAAAGSSAFRSGSSCADGVSRLARSTFIVNSLTVASARRRRSPCWRLSTIESISDGSSADRRTRAVTIHRSFCDPQTWLFARYAARRRCTSTPCEPPDRDVPATIASK